MTQDWPLPPLKVFLAEDSPMIQHRLHALLETISGVQIVGVASTPVAAIAGIEATSADLAIIDLFLDGGNALTVLNHFAATPRRLAKIVISNLAIPPFRDACLLAGADDFFDKTQEFMQVRDAVRRIAEQRPGAPHPRPPFTDPPDLPSQTGSATPTKRTL